MSKCYQNCSQPLLQAHSSEINRHVPVYFASLPFRLDPSLEDATVFSDGNAEAVAAAQGNEDSRGDDAEATWMSDEWGEGGRGLVQGPLTYIRSHEPQHPPQVFLC